MKSEPLQRRGVLLSAEVLVQRLEEDLIVGRRMREERHARAEFEIVRGAEDLLDAAPCDRSDQLCALAQAWAQDGVAKISFGLGMRRECEALGHRTPAEPLDLRKHEPHPVARLVAGAELRQHPLDDGLLRLNEAVETVVAITRG